MKYIYSYLWIIFLTAVFCCCRDENFIIPSENEIPDGVVPRPDASIKGVYILNEGNMGSNKCTLDFFDYTTGIYHRNIYAEINPTIVKELGDVGNDLKIYGNRLYAVINVSGYVEVMDVETAVHIGEIKIPNCRYITFHKQYAYISSYNGPVSPNPSDSRLGIVAEVDTATMQITRQVTVGYQPEQMAVIGEKLYVANSGGYNKPNYDRTVSVIDLNTFSEIKKIDVAPNLHCIAVNSQNNIYVSSRGDENSISSDTYIIDTQNDLAKGNLNVKTSQLWMHDDILYLLGYDDNISSSQKNTSYSIVDSRIEKVITENFITDGTDKQINVPYGLAVNPETGEILVSDAKDYVTPGTLYCFSQEGKKLWSHTTGDIPSRFAFTKKKFRGPDEIPEEKPSGPPPYISKVLDYHPAPGQFVNLLPKYENGDNQEIMNAKACEALKNNNQGTVSLGGYGGYIVVGFDHTIENVSGSHDFKILGNAFNNNSEPGIVRVAYDQNKNGIPDENEWYELTGSEHSNPATIQNYNITYYRPSENVSATEEQYIRWSDSEGQEGYISKVSYHIQSYYPQWVTNQQMSFTGTLLRKNAVVTENNGIKNWKLTPFDWGYADNQPNNSTAAEFDIDWAIDKNRNPITLPGIDFIMIYTGVNQTCGWIGETSTEVLGIIDLHLIQKQ